MPGTPELSHSKSQGLCPGAVGAVQAAGAAHGSGGLGPSFSPKLGWKNPLLDEAEPS